MPSLTLYSGNRLEKLADKFAEIVLADPLPVMAKEKIVLQSMGMMKWLTVEMSRRLGIWSNYEYIFPNRMTADILNSFFPGKGDKRFFDKEIMTWRCIDLILKERKNPFFTGISSYIKDDSTGVKLYQIASKIVDLFDQYMTFRPDMINSWDRGAMKGEWQAELWRMLTRDMTGDHPPALLERAYSILKSGENFIPADMPERITVFGISYIPMYHLNILRAASFFTDVNLFIMNPSSEYWGNILTEKEKRKIISTSPLIPGDPEDYLHIEQGNSLLASFGRVGRDFLYNIFMSDLDTFSLFEEPERKSLLSVIQNDIWRMSDGENGSVKTLFAAGEIAKDNSITVNSCHSSMREVEVLHDYIIDLLNSDKTLAPGDILVMSPDIEEYSSSIHGIFGRECDGIPRIPYRIIDRKLKNTSIVIDTFFKVLYVGADRFTSASVLGIADCGEIMEKFSLGREDLDKVGRWVRETSVFWGVDSAYRGELGLPAIYENTWRFGFDRMLMGGMMTGGDSTSLGILPYSPIEGEDLQILGRFISFFSTLNDIRLMLKKKYTIDRWSDVLNFILDSLFITGDMPQSLMSLSEAAQFLKTMQSESRFAGEVSVNVIAEFLDKTLSGAGSGRDFVSGNLTFCEMLPMRSIPCRVICILGMNDSSFPRKSKALSFDLTSVSPKRGDRSVRDEDKYLFLETLISAREKLYISYTGRSMSSNSVLNPSAVVSELLEYIDRFYGVDSESGSITGYIFTTHRIQPYNPVYFIPGSGYYTYQGAKIEGARSYAMNEKRGYRFFDKPLPPITGDEKNLSITDLAEFLNNPSKAMLDKRLGLKLGLNSDEFIESEPFTPDFIDQYNLNSAIMKSLREGTDRESYFNTVKASGILPHGVPGRVTYDRSFGEVKNFYDRFSYLLTDKSPVAEIDLNINGFRITGTADSIYNGKNIYFRYASARGRDILNAWITHLSLCMSGSFKDETLLISKGGVQGWGFIKESEKILADLLKIYEYGMTVPVPLFPKSSLKFAETFYDGKKGEPRGRALKSAAGAFSGFRYGGDSDDPYIQKLFDDFYSVSDKFADFTLKVYSPVFDNMIREVKL